MPCAKEDWALVYDNEAIVFPAIFRIAWARAAEKNELSKIATWIKTGYTKVMFLVTTISEKEYKKRCASIELNLTRENQVEDEKIAQLWDSHYLSFSIEWVNFIALSQIETLVS